MIAYTFPEAVCPQLPEVQSFLRGMDRVMEIPFAKIEDANNLIRESFSAEAKTKGNFKVRTIIMGKKNKPRLNIEKDFYEEANMLNRAHRSNWTIVEKLTSAFPGLQCIPRPTTADKKAGTITSKNVPGQLVSHVGRPQLQQKRMLQSADTCSWVKKSRHGS